ncbi:hypothetical protein Golax_005023 [Gossypium laxum]|uniref:Uncharacterized protein n=1 Tax=Gossypium laxum TaxID=34288 RepID=A0A7J8ZZH2_9ROSI|nr:hypothetical protein [Gossypium laxum]
MHKGYVECAEIVLKSQQCEKGGAHLIMLFHTLPFRCPEAANYFP